MPGRRVGVRDRCEAFEHQLWLDPAAAPRTGVKLSRLPNIFIAEQPTQPERARDDGATPGEFSNQRRQRPRSPGTRCTAGTPRLIASSIPLPNLGDDDVGPHTKTLFYQIDASARLPYRTD